MNKNCFPFTYFKTSIIPSEDAVVPIMTNALQYGTGVFGGIRGYWRKTDKTMLFFRPHDHFKRMLASLKILSVSIPYSIDDLVGILIRLANKNHPEVNTYCRPFAFASSLEMSPNLARDREFAFAMYMLPLNDYIPTDKGLSVMISSWRRIPDNAIPARGKISGAYINSALARKEAYDNAYDEAIFLSESGHVVEGSAENIFLVRNNVLITPSITSDILEGITRRTIIEIARNLDIPVEEREVDRTELFVADEMFFTGTGAQLAWISAVDKRMVGDGQEGMITRKLKKEFQNILLGNNEKYAQWNVSVRYKNKESQ